MLTAMVHSLGSKPSVEEIQKTSDDLDEALLTQIGYTQDIRTETYNRTIGDQTGVYHPTRQEMVVRVRQKPPLV